MEKLSFDSDSGGESWSLFAVGDCYLQPNTRHEGPLFSPALLNRAMDAHLSVANIEAPIPEPGGRIGRKNGPDTPE